VKIKNDRIDLNVVASQLEVGKQPQNGRLAYDGSAFDVASGALFTAIGFADEVSDSGRQRIIREALFSLKPESAITRKSLMAALARHEAKYLALPMDRFALLTTIAVKFGRHLRPINKDRVKLRFADTIPRGFDRKPFEEIHSWPKVADVEDYSWAVILIDARSNYEAFERGLRELDYWRGMWNFALTRNTISRDSSSPLPLADIGLGPVHTVHHARGAAVGGTFWYQPAFYPQPAVDVKRDWNHVSAEVRRIRRLHQRSSYPEMLREVFIRYARALDGVDFDSTFLKLWSLFEMLTVTTNARYDQSVERALFVFEEQELNRTVLEHLRDYRNATVHDALSTDLAHDFSWQLKQYVDALIKFHLFWSNRFTSVMEAGSFLSLPKDSDALRKRIATARQALRYLAG
jgi:hypothetical protein